MTTPFFKDPPQDLWAPAASDPAMGAGAALPSDHLALLDECGTASRSVSGDDVSLLPEPIPWDELHRPVDHSNTLLGDRFLERGAGMILFGPAGLGKSVANLQLCVELSAGLAAFHIVAPRPLKIVLLQTEDSLDDTREALAGILDSTVFTPQHRALVHENLILLPPVAGGPPQRLALLLDGAAEKHKPDIISVNPLLAFVPDDPAREIGKLLYQYVDPVIKRHRIGLLGVHHTPKMNNRDTSGYGAFDHQYLAAGDARIANWPRGMILIESLPNGIFRFRCVKRWRRIGWKLDGQPVQERFFKYADHGIRWVDASPEDAHRAEVTEDYTRLLTVLPGHDQNSICRERVRLEAKNRLRIGRDKADAWLKMALEDGRVERVVVPSAGKRSSMAFRLAPNR